MSGYLVSRLHPHIRHSREGGNLCLSLNGDARLRGHDG